MTSPPAPPGVANASWLPLVVVVLTQIQASFAVNALTVSMQGITTDLSTPATSVGTAITAGTFAMAAFILLGAKVGAKYGSRRVFQIAVAIHGAAMAAVALSVSPAMLFVAQAASGAVIALIAPALVVFISTNFHGEQQARAIGFLAAAIPAAGVLALLVAGSFASTIGWRWSFALVVAFAVVNLVLSFRIRAVPAQPDIRIDWTGAALAAGSVIMLSFGFSGLASWGLFLATPAAPFSVFGVSPAPLLIVGGVVGAQAFFSWTRSQQEAGRPQLFSLDVLKSPSERATTVCMATMLFVGTAANFLIPLYLQIVQGRTSFETSISVIPYTLSIFVASSVVAGFYRRWSPAVIARAGFVVVAAALTLLGVTIRNDWSQILVVVGLITLGLGQGAIVALVFNTLLTAVPRNLSGDVGAWRGLVHNIPAASASPWPACSPSGCWAGSCRASSSTTPPSLRSSSPRSTSTRSTSSPTTRSSRPSAPPPPPRRRWTRPSGSTPRPGSGRCAPRCWCWRPSRCWRSCRRAGCPARCPTSSGRHPRRRPSRPADPGGDHGGGGDVTTRYEFRVAGLLSERARGAFPDMTVLHAPPQTIILGEVLDESHLHGVLALIQNLGLHVVSVQEVPGADP